MILAFTVGRRRLIAAAGRPESNGRTAKSVQQLKGKAELIGQSLSLAGLQKRYGEALAVRELSLDIAAGEFVSLLGPSGSGKTTALTMIAGFESPSAGRIAIGGRDVTLLNIERPLNVSLRRKPASPRPVRHSTVTDLARFLGLSTSVPKPLYQAETKSSIRSSLFLMAPKLLRMLEFVTRFLLELRLSLTVLGQVAGFC